MSFDDSTRRRLAKMVSACRNLLITDLEEQLQRTYGLLPDGSELPLEKLVHLNDRERQAAADLREWRDHIVANEVGPVEERLQKAFQRMALESAFTLLNRLAALRMCEERALVLECVRKNVASAGFQLYQRLGADRLGDQWTSYGLFLERQFDDLAVDLGALFDRRAPHSRLFPSERCLETVLAKVNSPDLCHLWSQDETIGWIYQYFNPDQERKQMRKESSAPRNSRELAVRNQFFTPRYVVEFLTDNTLGRTWYEMRQGRTRLSDQCRYLVRRPDEVFLGKKTSGSEDAPEVAAMAKLLLEGTKETFLEFTHTSPQRLLSLAHCVDPDARERDGATLRALEASLHEGASLEEVCTQDLLDLLCLVARVDGHGGQEALAAAPYLSIGNEVRARALKGRQEDLSQEVLLKLPVFIPYRAPKDPRDLKILDPACGSGHFLLYAFDLLEVIYDEAWVGEDVPEPLASEVGNASQPWSNRAAFSREIPRLIMAHNLHGIDIDPRAVQIAALALWLRAQRTWQEGGLKAEDRPVITRSNIVCAEPMPGERDMLEEFTKKLNPRMAAVVTHAWERMQLAGEAGALLRIERDIAEKIKEADRDWGEMFQIEQGARWRKTVQQVRSTLHKYAREAANGQSFRKQLFAEDAARGFAFIELCWQSYDVVLMNPPFGYAPDVFQATAWQRLTDIDALFSERMVEKLHLHGYFGVITNRTQLFKPAIGDFRKRVLLDNGMIDVCGDLGNGVLDAMVETVAFTVIRGRLKNQSHLGHFVSCLATRNKQNLLIRSAKPDSSFARLIDIRRFRNVPDCRFAYWLTPRFLDLLNTQNSLSNSFFVGFGLSTTDNFRFLRLRWEVGYLTIKSYQGPGNTSGWVHLAKGGEYSPYSGDIHLLVDWHDDGASLKEVPNAPIRNELHYGLPGLTYSKRTASAFSPRILPAGCISEVNGPMILPKDSAALDSWSALVVISSRVAQYMIDGLVAAGDIALAYGAAKDYIPGVIGRIPLPSRIPEKCRGQIIEVVKQKQSLDRDEETHVLFCCPSILHHQLASRFLRQSEERLSMIVLMLESIAIFEQSIESSGFELSAGERRILDDAIGPIVGSGRKGDAALFCLDDLTSLKTEEIVAHVLKSGFSRKDVAKNSYRIDRKLELLVSVTGADISSCAAALIDQYSQPRSYLGCELSYFFGTAFGRWDIRYATGQRPIPELPDPFAPLPACPPGMLQNDKGRPLTREDVHYFETLGLWEYALEIPWDGILVDDPGPDPTQPVPHADDIVRRIQAVMLVIWGERAANIEREACDILGVKNLRDYFRSPSLFFADHLKRYSKSRRKAPIYWPLSTASGTYTLWIYYHRLSESTLFTAVNQFVKPKIAETHHHLEQLQAKHNTAGGAEATRLRDNIDATEAFWSELNALRDELLRVAELPYRPNLNDGVLITASPLYGLFGLSKWRKELEACWQKLEKGSYDWAHLAYTLWPDRVRTRCEKDKSVAIAHGLEDLYVAPAPKASRRRKGARVSDPKATAAVQITHDVLNPRIPGVSAEKHSRVTQPVQMTHDGLSPSKRKSGPKDPRRAPGGDKDV